MEVMKTIHFKSGKKLRIESWIARMLNDQIVKGCKEWQTFSDGVGNLICIINLNEVEFIA